MRPGEDPLDHYMHVITEKTGSLIATSGRFGAMFAGLPGETADLISEACLRIGVAWQLSDDVLDIASSSAESGKEQGTDLRQGVRTLPVLYALRGASGDPDAVRLRELLRDADLTDPELHAEALRAAARVPGARGGAADGPHLDRRGAPPGALNNSPRESTEVANLIELYAEVNGGIIGVPQDVHFNAGMCWALMTTLVSGVGLEKPG